MPSFRSSLTWCCTLPRGGIGEQRVAKTSLSQFLESKGRGREELLLLEGGLLFPEADDRKGSWLCQPGVKDNPPLLLLLNAFWTNPPLVTLLLCCSYTTTGQYAAAPTSVGTDCCYFIQVKPLHVHSYNIHRYISFLWSSIDRAATAAALHR